MNKEMQKIYLYDRWLFFEKETDTTLIYKSLKTNNKYIRLEYDKNTKNFKILYFIKEKAIGKLCITTLDNDIYDVNYQNFDCEMLEKEDDIYVNLLYNMHMKIEKQKLQNIYIKLSRKRKLNVMCYLEPTFPLEQDINIKNININNDQVSYLSSMFIELRYYIPIIQKQIEGNINDKISMKHKVIKKINVLDKIFVYDREYILIREDGYNLIYQNQSRGITTLKIELNPYDTKIKNAFIEYIPKDSDEIKDKIEISHIPNGNIKIKYINFDKINLELNREAHKNARLTAYAEYSNEGEEIRNEVNIECANKEMKLSAHPIYRSKFVSEDGIEYTISNSDYARYHGIQTFICPIVNNMEKKLYKDLSSSI